MRASLRIALYMDLIEDKQLIEVDFVQIARYIRPLRQKASFPPLYMLKIILLILQRSKLTEGLTYLRLIRMEEGPNFDLK